MRIHAHLFALKVRASSIDGRVRKGLKSMKKCKQRVLECNHALVENTRHMSGHMVTFRLDYKSSNSDITHSLYLVGVGVKEILLLVGAEQCVGVLLQRLRPGLKALTADVEPDPLVDWSCRVIRCDDPSIQCFLTCRSSPSRQMHGRRKASLSDWNPTDRRRSRERQPRSNGSHVST